MKSKILILIIVIGALITWLSTLDTSAKYSTLLTRERKVVNNNTFDDVSMENCENFAVLISDSKLAKRMNVSKSWIRQNYQIEIFADTLASRKHVIGHVPPGGHCYIVEQNGLWFFVQSPGSNELGWLHQSNVVGFVKKDPETLLPCPGRI
ncbi:MAG: hypothetical protein HQ508_04330 [Candidatus Marinimicrobia bacterium]|nr:hypothetical protein [Candidatus Neomarinimicrobiota bacterium]